MDDLTDLMTPWCVHTVATLGIARHLELRNVAAAMGEHSRLIVSGGVAADAAPRRLTIEMVLLAGTTDSLTAFRERAVRGGLDVVRPGEQADGRFYVELRRRH